MIVIVGARVKGNFLQCIQIEMGFFQQVGGGFAQHLKRIQNYVVIRTRGHADAFDVKRHRANLLVRIEVDRRARFQHGHRPITDIVIEPGNSVGNEFRRGRFRIRRFALLQDGFDDANQKEWRNERGWLMVAE